MFHSIVAYNATGVFSILMSSLFMSSFLWNSEEYWDCDSHCCIGPLYFEHCNFNSGTSIDFDNVSQYEI